MEGNDIYSPLFTDREDESKRLLNKLKEENLKLRTENEHLKKELEREQVLHKNLYKEWKELKSGESGEPRKFKRLVRKKLPKTSLYGLLAITIILSAFIFYLAFSRGSNHITISTPDNQQYPTLVDTLHESNNQK